MPRKYIKGDDFHTVGSGQKATHNIPPTHVYYKLIVELFLDGTRATKAEMETAVLEIDLKIGGRSQREFTAKQLFIQNLMRGVSVQDGYMPIFLAPIWARTADGEDIQGWGTEGVESFRIDVKLATGLTNPELRISYVVDDGKNRSIGMIEKWENHNQDITKTGETTMVLDTEPGDSYSEVVCYTDNILGFEAKLGSEIQREFEDIDTWNAHLVDHGLTPQPNVTTIMFNETNRANHTLPVAIKDKLSGKIIAQRKFKNKINMSVAESFDYMTVRVGEPD